MSEKNLFEKISGDKDQTFEESAGLPGNEQAKRKAKEKSSKEASKKKLQESFYTMKNSKVLKMTVKPNGAYSTYIGKIKKDKDGKSNKAEVEMSISNWTKKGEWVHEHEIEGKVKELLEKFNS